MRGVKRFTSIDDIERKKDEEERHKFKERVSKDIEDVVRNVFREDKKPEKKKNHFLTLLILLLLFLSFLIVLDIILGSILLIKLFIQSVF